MKQQTIVKWFDAKKGYGFLVHPDGGADIFVHYTSIVSDARFRTLRTGEAVTFEMYDGPKGVHARDIVSLDPLPETDGPFVPPSPEAAAENVAREVAFGVSAPPVPQSPLDLPAAT
jgi:cold shock protein